jgi:hypothetical protein
LDLPKSLRKESLWKERLRKERLGKERLRKERIRKTFSSNWNGIIQKGKTQIGIWPQLESLRKERLGKIFGSNRKDSERKYSERKDSESNDSEMKDSEVEHRNSSDMSVDSYDNRLASGYMHRPGVSSLAYPRLE